MSTSPQTPVDSRLLQKRADRLPWFHSLRLGRGVVTKGTKPLSALDREIETAFRYGVAGKTVLDIGAWDGAFSFGAEARGARRVLATDHFCWIGDGSAKKASKALGRDRKLHWPMGEKSFGGWGKKASFDFAKRILRSRVEERVIDVPDISIETIGQFDCVLLLGVFYHLKNPLAALERIAPIARELLVLETVTNLNSLKPPVMTFYPGAELGDDPTNWWVPNVSCVIAMLRHIGFKRVKASGPPPADKSSPDYSNRLFFYAWK